MFFQINLVLLMLAFLPFLHCEVVIDSCPGDAICGFGMQCRYLRVSCQISFVGERSISPSSVESNVVLGNPTGIVFRAEDSPTVFLLEAGSTAQGTRTAHTCNAIINSTCGSGVIVTSPTCQKWSSGSYQLRISLAFSATCTVFSFRVTSTIPTINVPTALRGTNFVGAINYNALLPATERQVCPTICGMGSQYFSRHVFGEICPSTCLSKTFDCDNTLPINDLVLVPNCYFPSSAADPYLCGMTMVDDFNNYAFRVVDAISDNARGTG